MHPYVELASRTIREYVTKKDKLSPPSPLPNDFKNPAGLFVCIKKKGALRGCIGTIEPTKPNLAEEIIENAISCATRDSRFEEVTEEELDDLSISIDILSKPEPVDSMEDLDPKVYGVVVFSGRKRGVLLPDLEGVNSPEQQVAICRRKAFIAQSDDIKIERFKVERYK